LREFSAGTPRHAVIDALIWTRLESPRKANFGLKFKFLAPVQNCAKDLADEEQAKFLHRLPLNIIRPYCRCTDALTGSALAPLMSRKIRNSALTNILIILARAGSLANEYWIGMN